MSGAIVWALLAVGVVAQLAGVVGVIVAADVYDRLHFTGPAAILGPFCFALAVVIDEGPLSQAGIKSLLVAVLLLGLSPVLGHATARAAYVRERGRLGPLSEEPRA
ncbi:MAG TPA: monovalent cation/H(+) antiporter subunit G [Thermoleophilaceae bacterium]